MLLREQWMKNSLEERAREFLARTTFTDISDTAWTAELARMVSFARSERKRQRERDAGIANRHPNALESVGGPGSGQFRVTSTIAAAILANEEED